MAAEIRFVLELFQIVTIRARIQTPVEIARVIAGRVLAILGELNRETVIGAAVQSVPESFDHDPRPKLEAADGHQCLRVNKAFATADLGNCRGCGGHDSKRWEHRTPNIEHRTSNDERLVNSPRIRRSMFDVRCSEFHFDYTPGSFTVSNKRRMIVSTLVPSASAR